MVAVEVPVNVVDRDGQPVRGLTADDFEIFDDGERQKITGFEVVDLDVLQPSRRHGAPAGAGARRRRARRHFLLLFDLSFSSPRRSSRRGWRRATSCSARSIRPTSRRSPPTRSSTGRSWSSPSPPTARSSRAPSTPWACAADASTRPQARPAALPDRAARARRQLERQPAGAPGAAPDLRAQRGPGCLEHLQTHHQRGRPQRAHLRAQPHHRLRAGARRPGQHAQRRPGPQARGPLLRGLRQPAAARPRRPRTRSSRATTINAIRGAALAGRQRPALRQHRPAERRQAHAGGVPRADCVIQAVDIGGLRADGERPAGAPRNAARRRSSTWPTRPAASCSRTPTTSASQLERVLRAHQRHLPADLPALRPQARRRLPPAAGQGARLPRAGARLSHRAGYYAPRPFKELDPLEKSLLASDGIASAAPRRDLDARRPRRAVPRQRGARLRAGDHRGRRAAASSPATTATSSTSRSTPTSATPRGEMRDFFTQVVALDLGQEPRRRWQQAGIKYYGHLDLPPGDYRVRVLVRNADTGRTGVESVPRCRCPPTTARRSGPAAAVLHGGAAAAGCWCASSAEAAEQPVGRLPLHGQRRALRAGGQAGAARARSQPASAWWPTTCGQGTLEVEGQVTGRRRQGRCPAAGSRWSSARPPASRGLDKLLATFEPAGLEAGDYVLQVAVTDPRTGQKELSSLPFQVVVR